MSGAYDEPDGRTIAAYVLYHYRLPGSLAPGHFYGLLIEAAAYADPINLRRFYLESGDRLLRKIGYCVKQVGQTFGGVERVQAIADGRADFPELKAPKR